MRPAIPEFLALGRDFQKLGREPMRQMGLHTVYRRPSTTIPDQNHLNPRYTGSRTHGCKHNGTVAFYAIYDILTGTVIGNAPEDQQQRVLAFMKEVRSKTPPDQELHIILDNLSGHKTPDVQKWQQANPDLHFHFTPISSSWLNAVEGWFAQLEPPSLYHGVFTSLTKLKHEIERFIKVNNKKLVKPFRWTKDAVTIIGTVERPRNCYLINRTAR